MQKRLVLLILVFSVTLAGVRSVQNLRRDQSHFPKWRLMPYQLSGWQGRDTSFDPMYGTDPADSSLLRVYHQQEQAPVIVYFGFYSNLTKILEVHTPELCYPAQGWSISEVRSISGGTFRGQEIHAKELIAEKGGEQRVVAWWYTNGSGTFENRIRYVYATLVMSVFTGRNDGSLIRIETRIEKDDKQAAYARIEDFQKIALPTLESALP